MNQINNGKQKPAEEGVVEFLLRHPDFLARHPKVLQEQHIPHESGAAVSLLEHQIRLLRTELASSRQQLEELLRLARENEELDQKLHSLTLSLIQANGLAELLDTLKQELQTRFEADAVELKLFTNQEIAEHAAEPGLGVFRDFVEADRPNCGVLSRDKLDALFGKGVLSHGSAALIPLRTRNLSGVLAIGSADETRFDVHKGVDFLVRLGELVSLRLQSLSQAESGA